MDNIAPMRIFRNWLNIFDKISMPYNKYHNKKASFGELTFDSKLERDRYIFLLDAEKKGLIRDLRRQVPFELTPEVRVGGKRMLSSVRYIADFTYSLGGALVIEDTKGYITPEFKIKRAVLRHFYGKDIRIVKHPAENI